MHKSIKILWAVVFGLGLLGGLSTLLPGAIDRGYQKHAMRDMRRIADCIASHKATHDRFPSVNNASELVCDSPVPLKDHWGGSYVIAFANDSYYVISTARGREPDVERPSDYEPGTTTKFEDDIVLRDGEFIRWPEGKKR